MSEEKKHIVQVKNPFTGKWSKMFEFGKFNTKQEAENEKRWLEMALGGEFQVVSDEPEIVMCEEQWV